MRGIELVAAAQATGARWAGAVAATARAVAMIGVPGIVSPGSLGLFIRQRQQGIALRAGQVPAALLPGKEHNKRAGQEQAKEYGEGDDRHGVDMSGVYYHFSG
jgi:hypothetical protein